MQLYAVRRDCNYVQNFCVEVIYRTDVCKTKNNEGFSQTDSKGVDWLHLAEDRDQWRTFVSTVMDHTIP